MTGDLPAHPSEDAGGGPIIPARTRERTVRVLCAHFAEDNIGLDDLERRLDLAYSATTLAQLDALTSDLPILERSAATEPVARPEAAPVDPETQVAESDFVLAVMSGVERKGRWVPPRRLTVAAVMGGAELDFRDATFGTRLTEVWVLAIMGGVDIVVPPGVRTEVKGLPIMGGFGSEAPTAGLPADAPTLRIRGLALMGGVDVKLRLPGESDREARRRLRAERRARRLQRGRSSSD